MARVSNKVALISGGARGMGASHARLLVEEGAKVVIGDLLDDEGKALADELGVFDIIRHETLTCYNGVIGDGCGHCPSCKLRKKGLDAYLASRK